MERGFFILAAGALCLIGFASKPEEAGRLTGLVMGPLAGLPEYGSLLAFGSALIGLGIWTRRRSR